MSFFDSLFDGTTWEIVNSAKPKHQDALKRCLKYIRDLPETKDCPDDER